MINYIYSAHYHRHKKQNKYAKQPSLTSVLKMGGRIAQWWTAYPKTKKSAVQASAMASCCGGELFTYIYLLLLILASFY